MSCHVWAGKYTCQNNIESFYQENMYNFRDQVNNRSGRDACKILNPGSKCVAAKLTNYPPGFEKASSQSICNNKKLMGVEKQLLCLKPNQDIKWKNRKIDGDFKDKCYECQVPAYDGNPDVLSCKCPLFDAKGNLIEIASKANAFLPYVGDLQKISFDPKNKTLTSPNYRGLPNH